jgi:hypothetical protein
LLVATLPKAYVVQVVRLAIDRDLLDDYSKLPKTVRASVKTAIDKFVNTYTSAEGLDDLVALASPAGQGAHRVPHHHSECRPAAERLN